MIKRYSANLCECFLGAHIELDEDNMGDLVKFDDYKSELDSLASELAAEHERANTAQARVKQLEGYISTAGRLAQLEAAETALASARRFLENRLMGETVESAFVRTEEIHRLLTSPPVAAPCSEKDNK